MATCPRDASHPPEPPAPAFPVVGMSATDTAVAGTGPAPGAGATLAPLAELLRGEGAVTDLLGATSGSSSTLAVAGAAAAVVLAGIDRLSARRPTLVVTATGSDAERTARDLACFVAPEDPPAGPRAVLGDLAEPVALLPAWETLPFERVSPEVATMGQRLAVLWHLFGEPAEPAGGVVPDRDVAAPRLVVAPVRAVLQRLGPWREAAAPLVVVRGGALEVEAALDWLVGRGYRREHQVEHRGEVAVRGGILDVFPSTAPMPVRIDLFGDEVDRLTAFDIGDQRSVADLDVAMVFGCRELALTDAVRARAAALVDEAPWGRAQWERLAAGEMFDGMESWLPFLQSDTTLVPDLLGADGRVVLLDPRRVRDRATELLREEDDLAAALGTTWGFPPGDPGEEPAGSGLPRLHAEFDRMLEHARAPVVSVVPSAEGPATPSVTVHRFNPVAGDPARLAGQVTELVAAGASVTLCARTRPGADRLAEVLSGEGVAAPVTGEASAAPGARVVIAELSEGFVLPEARLAVLSESDITGRRTPHRTARPRARPTDGFFDDLTPGSFVVHRQHGVARFGGVTTRSIGGTARDYLVLEYRGSDRLYLPVDQIEAVTPYSGGESPTLSKMGGADWQRTRARAKAAAGEIAAELVILYRRRLATPGHAFGPDTPWQREMESSFPYTETVDQLRAIADVKADMEQPRPMDRLVCGDVGFGKTEVALRAVFKAVQDGTQAAVLVPTTLLASQHALTFAERFAGYPVRVELLSRFLSPAQAKVVVAGLRNGTVDVVVGTHRLLATDVVFKNLGLLVVDEEQRFGVTHKEAVKRMAEGVDVLTLTASPIPRTLEMALTGIRDLSMVNTPPADRRPILTYVGEYDEQAVSEALRRELLREGQAFFVHNRVADIEAAARRIGRLVPEARIAIAHGQMDEGSLEQVVLDFWERRADVLVCTTIIESGIDMPSVNTLVVDRADLLGLGQLHQIRGRVGRAAQRAYAYLFHPVDRVLTEQAYERLRTIGEHTELGSGFKIAMRDLEIRGAGNLLGRDQSGHIAAVGYDLYVQLVAEAVAEARGEPRPAPPTVSLDVPGDAHLPTDYVDAEDARLEAYRRLAAAATERDVDDVASEWADRYGPLPLAAVGLVDLTRLRVECLRTGITDVSVVPARAGGARVPVARLSPVALAASAEVRLRRLAPDASLRTDLGQLHVPLTGPGPAARELYALVRALIPPPDAEGAEPAPKTRSRRG
jgi:transcription-repair coupling factor (superfamily II helicase)